MCCQNGVLFHPARGTFQLQKLQQLHSLSQALTMSAVPQRHGGGSAGTPAAAMQGRGAPQGQRGLVREAESKRRKPFEQDGESALLRARFETSSLMQPVLIDQLQWPR